MSELVSSMLAGNMPTGAGQTPAGQLTDAVDNSEASDFASLFGDVSFASIDSEKASADSLTELPEFMDPLLAAPLSDIDKQTQPLNDPLQAAMLQQNGKSLPLTTPFVAVSGFSALADQDGAAAIAFQGDGKHILATGPQFASTMTPAIQQSQAQLREIIQPGVLLPQDMEMLAVPKVDLAKQADLLASLSQQSLPTTTDSLVNLSGQQPSQALLGLQGATEFSNVLAASTRSPEPMTATLNQPQWNQQIGNRVSWMISQGLRQADIRLNPPELGMLEVRVQMQGDQATIQFNTAHADVKDALDSALPRLREMLAENGLELADVNVSQQGQQHAKQGEESSSDQSGTESTAESVGNIDDQNILTLTGNGIIDFYA